MEGIEYRSDVIRFMVFTKITTLRRRQKGARIEAEVVVKMMSEQI